MSDATRRTFLAAAGTGAAAAAAVAAAPGAVAAGASRSVHDPAAPTATARPGDRLVAYVPDATSARVTVMYGEHEVTVHDAELVRRLTAIARG